MSAEIPETAPKKKMSRRKKAWIIVSSIIAALLVFVLVYGFVITRSGYWLLSTLAPDSEEQQLSFATASETTQVIADEGFVLLENADDLLPLAASADDRAPISLFGMRSVQLVYNAGGSSASNVDRAVRLEDALQSDEGGFEVNQDLLNLYYNYYKTGELSIDPTEAPGNSSASEFIEEPSNLTVPEVPAAALSDESLTEDGSTLIEQAREFSDTALVTIGRGGGEMVDFAPSDLQLSADEAELIDAVATGFDDVILVVNSANPIELDFVEQYPSIKSVVWIGYPGESGIESLVRILNGEVNPSGHLADTWLKDNTASPAANNHLQLVDGVWSEDSFHYENAPEGAGYFTQYSEGIYVGYRYFESRHDTDPAFDYDAVVQYPFGHGLSYTEFDQQILGVQTSDDTVSVRVGVSNLGDTPGKDVVQLYSNPPYTGAIEKATANLVAFQKTNELQPGATETYTLEVPIEELASYDADGHRAWVLEAGDYELSIRANSHEVISAETVALDERVYDEDGVGARASDATVATNRFDDATGVDDYLTRDWDDTARAFTGPQASDYTAPQVVLDALDGVGVELDEPILFGEVAGLDADDPKWDEFVAQLTLQEMATMNGAGAWQIQGVERLDVPRTLTPDGSTTIGSSIYSGAIMGVDGSGVTYPIPQVVASAWNDDIARLMGTSVGNEAQALGFAGWYAPGMNTHRVPFNGRNFEYYSEDGLLAGKTAAGVVGGAREEGLITFMKHFALNDRETGTRSQLFQWSDEQAIREIYLKPFELAVKEGGSLGAMSSFNYIGPTWAGANAALLDEVLRDEWGFQGVVVTDANVYPFMDVVAASYAGGNLSLDAIGAYTPATGHGATLLEAAEAEESRIGMTQNLVTSTKQILFAVAQTWPVTQG